MPTDYEKVYQQQRHALGSPTQIFVDFFEQYDKPQADVLDIGCGQGRDALFIARRGHHVVGVDIAPTGIAQLLKDAQAEDLHIEGIVADLRDYQAEGTFDVVIIDRTLHMLDVASRIHVLQQVSNVIRPDGFVLIADEKSNMPHIRDYFQGDDHIWTIVQDKKSFVCLQRQ